MLRVLTPMVTRFLAVLLIAAQIVLAQQQPVPAAETQSVNIKSNEVLLDVLFRDKKGRMLKDVRAEEIEVYEDGVKQQITSFKLIGPESAEAVEAAKAGTAPPLSLATIVLDRFDPGRVRQARETALSFVDNALAQGVLARICVIGQRLYLVEQFTSDRDRLRKAIDRALAPSEKALSDHSDKLFKDLSALAAGGESSEALLAKLTAETLSGAEKSMRDAKSVSPVFSLLHLGRAQRHLPGRKLVVYFSNGLYLSPGLTDVLNAAISEANRANVTFYALDMRQLLASIGTASSRLETETVVNATRRGESNRYSDAYADSFSANRTTSNFNVFEVIRRRAEMGKQTALSELAEQTGGAIVTAVNDINGMLRRATSELGNYHLIAYTSSNQEFDGKFRKVEVKIARKDAVAQTRNGYFAVPPSAERPRLEYETALLAALNDGVVPRDFPLHAMGLRFESRPGETHYALLVETPLSYFIHDEDKEKKIYPLNFALLAMVKNEKGEIIQSFSEHHPLEIPSAQIEEARKLSITLTRDFWLAPGRYTIEVAAHDRTANRFSAERRAFTVAPPDKGLKLGSLYLIKQVEQFNERPADEANNPLFAGRTKILPETSSALSLDNRAEISFHLAVYPNRDVLRAPTLKLELLHEGKVVASTTPQLPKADESGRITFTAAIPVKGLYAGSYELRAEAFDGETRATEALAFQLTGGPQPVVASSDEGKTIESKLSTADRMGELTLKAIEAAKPVEIGVEELLRETAAHGAAMFRRLGEYTYSLRKVRRTLDRRGRIRAEEYNDYEAYPVRGLHALVQLSANGSRLSVDRIGIDRRHATEVLIEDESRDKNEERALSFWGARIGGYSPENKFVSILIDPEIFLKACEFSSPRVVALDGREAYVLDFQPRSDAALTADKTWIKGLRGQIWIDVADKALVRLEAHSSREAREGEAAPGPNFVYQQQRLEDQLWSPQLIRLNAAGDERLFGGLNWDAWFEFTSFKKFDATQSDVKITSPSEKQKED